MELPIKAPDSSRDMKTTRPGEIMAIAGPSGAGKTTLLEILAGMIPMTRFSDEFLFPVLTVQETLMYSARLRLHDSKRHGKVAVGIRVKELLRELGLEHVANVGEKRRVSIGVDLVHDPAVLLLDEPTSGLDSASALHVASLLKSMATKQGKTIVLTVHQPGHSIPRHVNVLEFAIDVTQDLLVVNTDESEEEEDDNIEEEERKASHLPALVNNRRPTDYLRERRILMREPQGELIESLLISYQTPWYSSLSSYSWLSCTPPRVLACRTKAGCLYVSLLHNAGLDRRPDVEFVGCLSERTRPGFHHGDVADRRRRRVVLSVLGIFHIERGHT
ncbi:putative Basic helix-loop-helix DNA-binding superfamily protein [Hibiscus syriacus]|uniref:Basic helix-loop-helix DNA-binding superfamily protein n=1 Tax=Hibiscus syriacus TaxID=106335 RepID=A0A6A3BRP0_HIBSY|nr:putative Basic helix-loop-helix DNA-binding superfamily protein [Hibiscus syriacus]